MGRVIIVASGKGGTGKTTATANLGVALSMRGKLVVLVDMDMGLRNLDVALGLESEVVYDVSDVVNGLCTIDDALAKDARYDNLYFIPAPQSSASVTLDKDKMSEFWQNLKNRFDYCLIDAPAGIDGGFEYAKQCATEAIVVTLPEISALRDADRTISELEDDMEVKLIINRVRPDMIERKIMMNIDDCMDMLGIPLLGIVPDDEELIIASLKRKIAVSCEESQAGGAFLNIAARLEGEEVPVPDFNEKSGFFERLKKLFAF